MAGGIQELRQDILNVPSRIFGEHEKCKNLGDKCVMKEETNHVIAMKRHGLYDKVVGVIASLADESESLLHRPNTNKAESANSLVCHGIGGKRESWIQKNQYNTRGSAQVVQFNTQECLSKLRITMEKDIPLFLEGVEGKRKRKVQQTKERRRLKGRKKAFAKSLYNRTATKFYGSKHQDVDKSEQEMAILGKEHLTRCKRDQENRDQFEEQNDNPVWRARRRLILSSSDF